MRVQAGTTPFATRAQLYSVLADRTLADRQLEELRRSTGVRLLQLPTSRDEHAVVLAEDYAAAVQRCKADVQARQQARQGEAGGSSSCCGGSVLAGAQAAADLDAFGLFLERVLPCCTDVMITHGELVQLLAQSPTPDGWVLLVVWGVSGGCRSCC